MAEEISRGREPITVKITPSLTIFLVTTIASIVGAVTWLNRIATIQNENREALRELRLEVWQHREKIQALEWRLQVRNETTIRTPQSP